MSNRCHLLKSLTKVTVKQVADYHKQSDDQKPAWSRVAKVEDLWSLCRSPPLRKKLAEFLLRPDNAVDSAARRLLDKQRVAEQSCLRFSVEDPPKDIWLLALWLQYAHSAGCPPICLDGQTFCSKKGVRTEGFFR